MGFRGSNNRMICPDDIHDSESLTLYVIDRIIGWTLDKVFPF